jgi:PDZ domain
METSLAGRRPIRLAEMGQKWARNGDKCGDDALFYGAGSPADKADLEIGDEILEVNGKSLEGATHTEVISHIHQVNISFIAHSVTARWATPTLLIKLDASSANQDAGPSVNT